MRSAIILLLVALALLPAVASADCGCTMGDSVTLEGIVSFGEGCAGDAVDAYIDMEHKVMTVVWLGCEVEHQLAVSTSETGSVRLVTAASLYEKGITGAWDLVETDSTSNRFTVVTGGPDTETFSVKMSPTSTGLHKVDVVLYFDHVTPVSGETLLNETTYYFYVLKHDSDLDYDGLNNIEETRLGTNMWDWDTDDDLIIDSSDTSHVATTATPLIPGFEVLLALMGVLFVVLLRGRR